MYQAMCDRCRAVVQEHVKASQVVDGSLVCERCRRAEQDLLKLGETMRSSVSAAVARIEKETREQFEIELRKVVDSRKEGDENADNSN